MTNHPNPNSAAQAATNNTAQNVLTDDEINTACDWPAANTTMRAENDRAMAREVEAAVLSKLRAPVADERATKALNRIERRASDDQRQRDLDDLTVVRDALQSSHVSDERELRAAAQATCDALKAVARFAAESLDDRDALVAAIVRLRAALASAPVAGHQPYPAMPEPDVNHPGEQEDGYSRAAVETAMRAAHDRGYSVGWDHGKEHASAPVAGDAQIIGYVPPIYLEMRRRGMPVNSKIQHSPVDDATAPIYAAPQASAEDVRNAALEALEAARQFIGNGIELGYIRMPDADTPDPAHRTPGLIDAAIRALKQPLADKDGGRDRAAFDHPVFAFLLGESPLHGVHFGDRHPSERGAYWWRKDLRAALSAAQAEQGERDE
ncbi:hypothetical protein [Achromobacter insuavis]|uniref:hypothetical protein n=1 Tax=Achromobacter insuavis TaxID=1287735 RepID=UPI001F12AE6F|nr:hypothetical protein [Achromobacter insuavis]